MKIQKKSKNTVKACDESVVCDTTDTCLQQVDGKSTALEYIQSAISALSTYAVDHPEDNVVTDSIANLGVVSLDLKSCN